MKTDRPVCPGPVIPEPVERVPGPGRFVLTGETVLAVGEGAQGVAGHVQDFLAPATGFPLPIEPDGEQSNAIRLVLSAGEDGLPSEGYRLRVAQGQVCISAPAPVGLFYGFQTLRQLLPSKVESAAPVPGVQWAIPCVEIQDRPRFPWRGYMLDEGRHFLGKEAVKRTLDLMALLKLNVFHWHLTEDQGWRIEIERYPCLTEVGSMRLGTQVGGFLGNKTDGVPHGGYYTQEDVREIVAYAARRFITVVPEIEMPGHSLAALAAYPELSCTGGPFEVTARFGIHPDIYCAGKERTFVFLQGVLDEVMDMFPSPIIHIGGDEAPKGRWRRCPDCQARMQVQGIRRAHDLQVYFTNRVADYLASHGRRLMGWNQILRAGLNRSAVGHYWIGGLAPTLAHARQGGDVVMSNCFDTYLDHPYSLTPLSRAYRFDPVPAGLEAECHSHVLGLEALMWSESVPTLRRLDWQTFPRLLAFAETGWTPKDRKDWASFRQRLAAYLPRLDRLGVVYAPLDRTEAGFWGRLFSPFTILVEQKDERRI